MARTRNEMQPDPVDGLRTREQSLIARAERSINDTMDAAKKIPDAKYRNKVIETGVEGYQVMYEYSGRSR